MDGILLINKPAGYTSHDIVGIVRKKLHTKKVGHCGTLDPDATGVLVVCVNKATKAIQFLMSDTKVYRDRKSTRLNSSHIEESRMPSSA